MAANPVIQALRQTADPAMVQHATEQLAAMENQSFPTFVAGLCEALSMAQLDVHTRMQACMQLKNGVTSADLGVAQRKAERWGQLQPNARAQVKQLSLNMLTDPTVGKTAALVVGAIGAIEIPRGEWKELLPALDSAARSADAPPKAKEAAFRALGVLCENCGDDLASMSHHVLGMIAAGMGQGTTEGITLEATKALMHTLEFAKDSFAKEAERKIVMNMILHAAKSTSYEVREVSVQCMVEVADMYYEVLEPYMTEIFNHTSKAIENREENEGVKKQALLFWTVIAEREMELLEEATLRGAAAPNLYTLVALGGILPLVLASLPRDESEDMTEDAGDWTVSMAAGVCLTAMSRTARDHVLAPVVSFVEANINHADWRMRDAATVAFGSVMEGPNPKQLVLTVKAALPVLLKLGGDESMVVRGTAAWTVGQICRVVPEVVDPQTLGHVMHFVSVSLQSPVSAGPACFVIHNLAQAAASKRDEEESPLSPQFAGVLQALYNLATQAQADHKVLVPAFEAIGELVNTAPRGNLDTVKGLYPAAVQQLLAYSTRDDEHSQQMQSHFCGAVQSVIGRLDEQSHLELVTSQMDNVVNACVNVLKNPSLSSHQDALMLISAVANRLEVQFDRYLSVVPYIITSLNQHDEIGVCQVANGVVGDVARAVGTKLVQFAPQLMEALLKNLCEPEVDRQLKPFMIGAVGDLAMALEAHFDHYMAYVMPILTTAGATTFPADSMTLDDYEFLVELRSQVLNALTGVVNGVCANDHGHSIRTHMPSIFKVLDVLAGDPNPDDELLTAVCGLVGDMASNISNAPGELQARPSVRALLTKARSSQQAQANLQWAQTFVKV